MTQKIEKEEKISEYQKGFIAGLELGKKEGRKQLQKELLNLLGAFNEFEGLKEYD